jgi:hypothetical protein
VRPLLAIALALSLATGCSSRKDEALGKNAVEAMRELNEADASFPLKVNEALAKLRGELVRGTAGVADAIRTAILPLYDEYLAKIDRAVAMGDAYLATLPDKKPMASFEVIRKRAEVIRKARAQFVELEAQARAGATLEQIGQALMAISVNLMLES